MGLKGFEARMEKEEELVRGWDKVVSSKRQVSRERYLAIEMHVW